MASSTSWLSAVKRRHSKERPQLTESIKPMKSSKQMSLNYQQSNLKQYFSAAMKDVSHEIEECSKNSSSFKRIKMEMKYINDSKHSDSVGENSRTSNLKLNNAFIKIETIVLSSSENDSPCENDTKSMIQTDKNESKTSTKVKQDVDSRVAEKEAQTRPIEKQEAKTRPNEKHEAKTRPNVKQESKTRPNEKQEAKTRPNKKQEAKHSLSPKVMIVPLSSYSQSQDHLWDSLSFHTGPLVPFKPLTPFGTELVLETPPTLDDTNNEENNSDIHTPTLDNQFSVRPLPPLTMRTELTSDDFRANENQEAKSPEMVQTKTVTDEKLQTKTQADEKSETKTRVTVVPLSFNNEKLWTKTRPNEKQKDKHTLSQRVTVVPLSSNNQSQEHLWDSLSLHTGTLIPFKPLSPFGTELVLESPRILDDTSKPCVSKDTFLDSQLSIRPLPPFTMNTEFTMNDVQVDEKREAETRVNEKLEIKTRVNEKLETKTRVDEEQKVQNTLSQEMTLVPASSNSQSQEPLWDNLSFHTGTLVPFKQLTPFGTELVLETSPIHDVTTKLDVVKENNDDTLHSLIPLSPFTRRTDLTLGDLRVDEVGGIQTCPKTNGQSQVQ